MEKRPRFSLIELARPFTRTIGCAIHTLKEIRATMYHVAHKQPYKSVCPYITEKVTILVPSNDLRSSYTGFSIQHHIIDKVRLMHASLVLSLDRMESTGNIK